MNLQDYNPYQAPRSGDVSEPRRQIAEESDLPDSIVVLLRETRPWILFLAVLGFLGAGLCVLVGLITMIVGSFNSKLPAAFGIVYFIAAAIYVFPSLHLLRFSSSIDRLTRDPRMTRLEVTLGHQRDFWRFVGICAIVIMVLYGLLLVGALVFGMMSAMR